jgi:hypothetical protein
LTDRHVFPHKGAIRPEYKWIANARWHTGKEKGSSTKICEETNQP